MLKFSALSQIWKKYIQKLNDWDLPLTLDSYSASQEPYNSNTIAPAILLNLLN